MGTTATRRYMSSTCLFIYFVFLCVVFSSYFYSCSCLDCLVLIFGLSHVVYGCYLQLHASHVLVHTCTCRLHLSSVLIHVHVLNITCETRATCTYWEIISMFSAQSSHAGGLPTRRRARRADTNVLAVKFNTLTGPSHVHTGDAVVCSNPACTAILSHLSELRETTGQEESKVEHTTQWVHSTVIAQCDVVMLLLHVPCMHV